MFLKKIGAGLSGAIALGGAFLWSTAASALPVDWQTGFQPAASPVMDWIEDFHRELLVIIVAVSLFVLALLGWIVIRYNQRRNPVPSKTAHNTLLEVAWTLIPVIILVIIAIPSFRLLYFEAGIPTPDLTIKAIGKQWFWTYEYPASNITFDSLGLSDADAAKKGEPRLLGYAAWLAGAKKKFAAIDDNTRVAAK